MNTEYVRNLHSNYVRLTLGEKPEEKRYQYCILSRGGIKGLLPCSLRYQDGGAYLYYDITSKQNIVQFHQKGTVSREWLLDFFDSYRKLQRELERFLLQEGNVIWEPRHVFQDLESNVFSFMYVPYYEGKNQFLNLLTFLVEKIDYEDSALVECVYKMYEQVEKNGEAYLQEQIFKDVEMLEKMREKPQAEKLKGTAAGIEKSEATFSERTLGAAAEKITAKEMEEKDEAEMGRDTPAPKRLLSLFENKKSKRTRDQEKREEYREAMQRMVSGYAVAEESEYDEGYGRTAFISQRPEKKEGIRRLYHADGRKASDLDTPNLLIGKYKDKVDLYLEDESVSRMHARILKDQDGYYLEDENSTNGSYCNKNRLQPYERRKLEPGDELRIGNVTLFFR